MTINFYGIVKWMAINVASNDVTGIQKEKKKGPDRTFLHENTLNYGM